ncbi:hypothetical protein ILUMI_10171 [Ignelater luminosus]|uniref:Uncharacterized protein n=1 Tax=Ignelater luminosus TaxID=2038154 RepID=A0A8K0CYL8_IGNLU|nr:hypothetical protein ILUMI_10171 [Ignelater luminosus]
MGSYENVKQHLTECHQQAEKIPKNNIDKRRHENDVVGIGLKIQEWNQNGKNYAFFFKQEGESGMLC